MSMPLPEYPWFTMLFRAIFWTFMGIGSLGIAVSLGFKVAGWKKSVALVLALFGAIFFIYAGWIVLETR